MKTRFMTPSRSDRIGRGLTGAAGAMVVVGLASVLGGCSPQPRDSCADVDRRLIASVVGSDDFTTSETGELPVVGDTGGGSYTCHIAVDGHERVRISVGRVDQLRPLNPDRPGYYTYGPGRGYLTSRMSTLGCRSIMHAVAGTEVGEEAIDASRGAMAGILIDLADRTGCR